MDTQPIPESFRRALDLWKQEQASLRQTGTRPRREPLVFEKDLWIEQGPLTARFGVYPYADTGEYIGREPLESPRGSGLQLRATLAFKF